MLKRANSNGEDSLLYFLFRGAHKQQSLLCTTILAGALTWFQAPKLGLDICNTSEPAMAWEEERDVIHEFYTTLFSCCHHLMIEITAHSRR